MFRDEPSDRPRPKRKSASPLISLAQVRKCYEFRVSFEGEAAYNAAQNRNADMLTAMRDALERRETAIGEMGGMNADVAFHQAVARASGNGRKLAAVTAIAAYSKVPDDHAGFLDPPAGFCIRQPEEDAIK